MYTTYCAMYITDNFSIWLLVKETSGELLIKQMLELTVVK